MQKVIFYSWQSDLPNSTNRGFIEAALRKAASIIASDSSIQIEPVVERDTEGASGAPDISKTILEKIDKSDLFVGDISIINQGVEGRPTPNPNVLLELGYAIKSVNWDKIILVMNKEFGGPEFLPFDLKMRRVIVYSAKENQNDRTGAKKILEQAFDKQIRSMLSFTEPKTADIKPHEKFIEEIENQTPKRIREARSYMEYLNKSLEDVYPGPYNGSGYDEILVKSLAQTTELVTDFIQVTETVATYNDEGVLKELFQGFKKLCENYHLPIGYNGRFSDADFDFYKFIGNELFTALVSVLLREQKWQLIKELLEYRLIINNVGGNRAETVDFNFIGSFSIESFTARDQRLHKLSARGHLLDERHNSLPISELSPMSDYTAADFFLYLKSKRDGNEWPHWIPWSSVYIDDLPNFLIAAQSKKVAQKLMDILNFQDLETFKTIIVRCAGELTRLWQGGFWRNPITEKSVAEIGKYA